MDPLNLAWSAAGIAGAVAFGLLVRASGEGRRTSTLRSDLAEARKEVRGGRKHEEQRSKALRNSDAELDKIGRQLSKAHKQVASLRDGARDEREQHESRIRELEQADQRSSEQGARLTQELDALREEFTAAAERARHLEAELAKREREQQSAAAEASAPEALASAEATIGELTRRAETAEAALATRDAAFEEADGEKKRLAERIRVKETLYVSMRGELAVKKDQIKQQREELERLRAYRVALAEPESAAEVDRAPALAEQPAESEPAPAEDHAEPASPVTAPPE
jgi:chromosome segregation ATPase